MTPQHRFIILVANLVWMMGAKSSDDVGVSQTPRDVFRKADGDDITLSFTQTHANCDTIQWYRRVPGSRFLQLVALANYQKASVEPAFTDCVNVSGDGRTAAQLRILTHRCVHPNANLTAQLANIPWTKVRKKEPNASITLPKVTLFPPSEKECTNEKDRETKKKTLVCAANDFYPDHVSVAWMVDGQKRETGVATDPEALKRGASYSITSRLRVPADEWSRGSRKFTCVVRFFDGKDYVDVPDSIFGNDDAEDGQSRESFLKLTQSAKLSYGVLIAKSCVYAAFVAFLLWRIRVGCSLSLSCPEDGRGKRIALNSL